MADILTVQGLTKSYGDAKVVKGVTFSVKKGEIFGILGPNGAGKTTTLEMIEALRPIDDGEAFIGGISVRQQPRQIKEIIGIQLQNSSFYERLRLTELIKMFAGYYGSNADPMRLLDEVQLTDKAGSYVEKLSGGQKQRFSIAAALVNRPKVLFLDEPTTGLDPQARHNLWELVESIKKKGITVVLTTHYMDEAERLCDRVAIMDKGEIIALDKPSRLIKQLLAKGFKKAVKVRQANLEDVFIDLTGKALRD